MILKNGQENYENVVSVTDTSQYVPLCVLLNRMARGENVSSKINQRYNDKYVESMRGQDIVDAKIMIENAKEVVTSLASAQAEAKKIEVEKAKIEAEKASELKP